MEKKTNKDMSQENFEQFRKTFEGVFLGNLQEYFDGFVIVGYRAGDHLKFAYVDGEDPACSDALNFFHPAVAAWFGLGEGDEGEGERDFVGSSED